MKHKRSDLEGDHSHRICGPESIQLADGRYVLGTQVFLGFVFAQQLPSFWADVGNSEL